VNAQAIDILSTGLEKLPVNSRSFAQSMLGQFKKYGKLSEKQWLWVEKMADEIECFGVPDFSKPAPVAGALGAIVEFFDVAAQKLKYPAITLQFQSGASIKLARAGQYSKHSGMVNVTDGGSYGNNKFYGRITLDGVFDAYGPAQPVQSELTRILAHLSQNPAKVAAEHGVLTSRCCFCNDKLSDPLSKSVGYGKTCSLNWGLPYGKDAMDKAIAAMPSNMKAAFDKLPKKVN